MRLSTRHRPGPAPLHLSLRCLLSSLHFSQTLMLLVLWLDSLISYYPLVIRQSILYILPFAFTKVSKVRQTTLTQRPPPPTPPFACSSSTLLLTGCHVRQPSPRRCLAFLSPLTAARVKPLGFAQTGIQLEGKARTCGHDLSAALTRALPPVPASSRQDRNIRHYLQEGLFESFIHTL